jgi:hypothetical protein
MRDVPHPLFPRLLMKRKIRSCQWVGPNLCSFCSEDGGPPWVRGNAQHGPEDFSGLVDRFGQPLLKSCFLPR